MININELRRLNLVQDEHGIFLYVYQIWPYGCELSEDVDGRGDCDYRAEEIFPIPLTTDILLKCGFTKLHFADYRCEMLPWFILACPNYWGQNEVLGLDDKIPAPQYLHQLQNLIHYLTGKELTLNL